MVDVTLQSVRLALRFTRPDDQQCGFEADDERGYLGDVAVEQRVADFQLSLNI